MRLYRLFVILMLALTVFACAPKPKYSTPVDTLRAYANAVNKKDLTAMKLLLSSETIKMHEEEAKQQNLTLDDIVQRETMFAQGQTTQKIRNEKIEGDRATIEVENSFGGWDVLPFVMEDAVWKIDKKGFAHGMRMHIEQQTNQGLDSLINEGRIQ